MISMTTGSIFIGKINICTVQSLIYKVCDILCSSIELELIPVYVGISADPLPSSTYYLQEDQEYIDILILHS